MSTRVAQSSQLLLLLLLPAPVVASSDGGLTETSNRERCESVRKIYSVSVKGHLLIKYAQDIERCVQQNRYPVRFSIRTGRHPQVKIESATKEQASCLRAIFRSLSFPRGAERTFDFKFAADWMEDPHERVSTADLADAGGKDSLGWCLADGDCLPDGVCSCGSEYCSVIPSGPVATEARGTCLRFAAIQCVRD